MSVPDPRDEAAKTCGLAVGTLNSRADQGRVSLEKQPVRGEGKPLTMTDVHTMTVVAGGAAR